MQKILINVFVLGSIFWIMNSGVSAQQRARLVFNTSYLEFVTPGNPNRFGNPEGIGTAKGKSIRTVDEGSAAYAWEFPETISPAGAVAKIGVSARASEKGSGITAVLSCIGVAACSEVSVAARPGEGFKKAPTSFTIVPQPAYESQLVYFKIRCHGGFDVVFRYRVEQ